MSIWCGWRLRLDLMTCRKHFDNATAKMSMSLRAHRRPYWYILPNSSKGVKMLDAAIFLISRNIFCHPTVDRCLLRINVRSVLVFWPLEPFFYSILHHLCTKLAPT